MPTPWTTVSAGPGDTEKTIGSLTNGSDYLVEVRACNHGLNEPARCGPWSDSATGTPMAPRLARPEDLDITPLPLRRARLTWTGDANAAGYKVEVRKQGGDWQAPNKGYASSVLSDGIAATAEYTMDLAKLLNTSDTSDVLHGLAHEGAYLFRVKATSTTGSAYKDSTYSGEVRIIDSPITTANGDSRGRDPNNGKAAVAWSAQPGATSYSIRWRKLPNIGLLDHTLINWHPRPAQNPQDWAGEETILPPTASDTIDGLEQGHIYAIQLNYEYQESAGPGASVSREGFSVREAYVWPSAVLAGDGRRVATFPLNNPFPSKSYPYVFCKATFPSGQRDEWQKFITHAISQWDLATNGLVTTEKQQTETCADYSGFVDEVVMQVTPFATSPRPPGGSFPSEDEIKGPCNRLVK